MKSDLHHNLPNTIQGRLSELSELSRQCHVRRLDLIGSSLQPDSEDREGRIDFIVEFLDDAPIGGLRGPYFDLLFGLKELFSREVGLVEYKAVRNPYFREEIDETRLALYGTPHD